MSSAHPRHRARLVATSTAGLLALSGLLVTATPAAAGPNACEKRNNNTIAKLTECVTLEGVREHQAAFQAIAEANEGNRASGTKGYDASAEYVTQRLEAAGYSVQSQEFDFPYFELRGSSFAQASPVPTDYVEGTDYQVATYSGSGDLTGTAITPVDVTVPLTPTDTSTSGCDAADFAGFPAGDVALVQRGSCNFSVKVANAETAGAAGVLIANRGTAGNEGVVGATLGEPGAGIPVIGISFALGSELATADATVDLMVEAVSEIRRTANLTAELRGKTSEVVAVGAHLDGVPEGPGMNDNASGSSAVLEVAEQMAKVRPEKTVRFAWWGAEELGLLGAEYYVESLPQAERDRISAYLNFDMVGSPNFARFIYDSDGSTFPAPPGYVTPESTVIEQTFEAFYDSRGLTYEDTEFDGRSDYKPFADVGIPSGGLFTGAEDAKTPEQAIAYGGTAGQAFDPCYHAECDTFDNQSLEVLDQNSDAIAYATLTLAQQGRGGGS